MKTTCARCNKEKENPHTKSSYCKKCHNEKIKEWKTNNPEKAKLIKQKETLSIQTRDSERRIFDYVKMNQDNDQKIRQNAIFIKDLVQERDKYKELQEEKEKEIG